MSEVAFISAVDVPCGFIPCVAHTVKYGATSVEVGDAKNHDNPKGIEYT